MKVSTFVKKKIYLSSCLRVNGETSRHPAYPSSERRLFLPTHIDGMTEPLSLDIQFLHLHIS